MSNFIGVKVELLSEELGSITGTVKSYNSSRIDLVDAVVNGGSNCVSNYSVDRRFIKRLQILSISGDPALSTENGRANSSRDQRRDHLRNIPNTYSVYVCPSSPPRVARSHQSPSAENLCSPRRGAGKTVEKGSDPSPAGLDKSSGTFINRTASNASGWRSRSKSAGEGALGECVSGCESEPVSSSTVNHGKRSGSKKSRNHTSGRSRRWGNSQDHQHSQTMDSWDSVRVEDFIDEDFDFEANLALFDKQAFYDEADAKLAADGKHPPPRPCFPADDQVLVEGPNGIGFVPRSCDHPADEVLLADSFQEARNGHPTHSASFTHGQSSIRLPFQDSAPSFPVPPTSKSVASQQPLGKPSTPANTTASPPLQKPVSSVKASQPAGTWFSSSGQRVPVLSPESHERLLRYLATGEIPELKIRTAGLSWARLIEGAGQTVANVVTHHLRQTGTHGLRAQHSRHPLRVVVLTGSPNVGSALAVNTARHLANRGACVLVNPAGDPALLFPPAVAAVSGGGGDDFICSESTSCPQLAAAYRAELALAKVFAPRPALYGLCTDDYADNHGWDNAASEEDSETETDDDGDDDDMGQNDRRPGAAAGEIKCSSPRRELSQVGRMWISRIPGLKFVNKPSGITRRPRNTVVDLLLLAQPVSQLDRRLQQWLSEHTAIGLAVQLSPLADHVRADVQALAPRALQTWFFQLGLPTFPPDAFVDAVASSLHLVDVGMTRSLVSKVTGDLRVLPPPALFETSSHLRLSTEPGK